MPETYNISHAMHMWAKGLKSPCRHCRDARCNTYDCNYCGVLCGRTHHKGCGPDTQPYDFAGCPYCDGNI